MLCCRGPHHQKDPKATTEKGVEEKNNSQITSVVANVMIGIGNKPYIRGEGPGLSWEEGIAMNFVEIGKWAWSPSRKNASLTIQIYRNDEDPDKTGKHVIKPRREIRNNTRILIFEEWACVDTFFNHFSHSISNTFPVLLVGNPHPST